MRSPARLNERPAGGGRRGREGTPGFGRAGTDIEVHRIAALLGGGMTPQEVCEDYPSLTPEAVAVAKTYAEAYPKPAGPIHPRR